MNVTSDTLAIKAVQVAHTFRVTRDEIRIVARVRVRGWTLHHMVRQHGPLPGLSSARQQTRAQTESESG